MANPLHNGVPEATAVRIPTGNVVLSADLAIPPDARVIVAFAHGSGSGRHSTRNRYVAETLNRYNFATLLADLLTEEEEIIDMRTRHLRFDIPMLADRLIDIATWLQREPQTKHLKIGWFGASTGAGAALIAAARRPENIMAVVFRGGRPDLAGDYLPEVMAPVLLIVGENDPEVLKLNKSALALLNPNGRSRLGYLYQTQPICLRSPARSRRLPSWRRNGFKPILDCREKRFKWQAPFTISQTG